LSLLAQLLSQSTKNVIQQAQQTPQQNGEELQYSASLLSTVAPQQTHILLKKLIISLSSAHLFLLPLSSRLIRMPPPHTVDFEGKKKRGKHCGDFLKNKAKKSKKKRTSEEGSSS
jgi:hypothetical protein